MPGEAGPMHPNKNGHLRLADRPADYERLGISPADVAQFEDGQRIGTERGRYEWWYFDAHLDDGATVVVVFYTKPNVSPNSPLAPRVTINLTLPDDRDFVKILDTRPELFSASKSTCDVRIGTNRFVSDLNRYHITATIEEISVDIELTADVPAWRPKSGHLYFGAEGRDKLFAWLRYPTDRQTSATRSAMRNIAPPAADITITTGATSPCRRSCTTGIGHVAASVPTR